ncbi:hypothetical protein [Campylobacter sp.]|uniref:hypothetical protein n=1 Tax=Campylobacter sp. TaxID=205 RepID=UPI002A7638D7|nr:hypothetical protein [Campylobacter sp.]
MTKNTSRGMTQGLGNSRRNFGRNFRILCDEIPRSSRGMTENASRGMTQGLGILDGILDGILNEIAPSALLPRNDEF